MQLGTPQGGTAPKNIVQLPGMYNDAMQMLLDAHEYFFLFAKHDQTKMQNELRPIYTCEMSRITLRLSSVMAWLMVRRAVSSGRISEEEAAEKYTLGFRETCLINLGNMEPILPAPMCKLMADSLELYQRVLRLDELNRVAH